MLSLSEGGGGGERFLADCIDGSYADVASEDLEDSVHDDIVV